MQIILSWKQSPINSRRAFYPLDQPTEIKKRPLVGVLTLAYSQHLWVRCGRHRGSQQKSVLGFPLCPTVAGWPSNNWFTTGFCLFSSTCELPPLPLLSPEWHVSVSLISLQLPPSLRVSEKINSWRKIGLVTQSKRTGWAQGMCNAGEGKSQEIISV